MFSGKNPGFLLIMVLILSACGGKNETLPSVNVAGQWTDTLVIAQECGQVFFLGLEFDLTQTENRVTGPSTLTFVNSQNQLVEIPGTLTGKVSGNNLTGSVTYPIEQNTLRFNFSLKHNAETLTGTLTSPTRSSCDDGSQSTFVAETVLITEDKTPVNPDVLEPNNQATQAKTIQAGKTLEGLTIGKGDVDWFKFTLTETTYLVAALELFSEFPARIQLFNQSANLLATKDISSGLETQVNLVGITPTLQAGSYYLAVSAGNDGNYSGNHSENGKYSLELIADTNPENFYEPNDTQEQAYEIPSSFEGSIFLSADDIDWFRFDFPKATLLIIEIISSTPIDLRGTLFIDQKVIDSKHFDSQYVSHTFAVNSGTYDFRIMNTLGLDSVNYILRVKTASLPDQEFEPNNTRDDASLITLDFSQSLLLTPQDEDWLTFGLEESKLVTFDISPSDQNMTIDVYKDSNLLFTLNPASISKVTRILPIGVYFIHSYGAEQLITYPLKISSTTLPDQDIEPNETMNDATPITLPFDRDLAFLTYNNFSDEDWFTFTLPEKQLLNLSFNLFGDNSVLGEFHFGESIDHFSSGSKNPQYFPFEAGTYFMKLHLGQGIVNVKLSTESIPDLEYEPNNTQSEASQVSIGFNDQNLLASYTEHDFYTFNVSQTAQFKIQKAGDVNATLFDGSGNYISSASDIEPILNPGKYVVGVSGNGRAVKYGLSILLK